MTHGRSGAPGTLRGGGHPKSAPRPAPGQRCGICFFLAFLVRLGWSVKAPQAMITLKFYLDARAVKAGEAAPVRLSVHQCSKRAFINTGVRVKPDQWDKGLQRVRRRPDAGALNARLKELMERVEALVWDLHGQGRFRALSVTEVKNVLVAAMDPETQAPAESAPEPRAFTLAAMMEASVRAHHGRTRELYECTVDRLRAWLGNEYEQVRPEDVTRSWLERFDAFLARTSPSRNARNIHFRNIRAAFNRAIDDELTTHYPFRGFKLRYDATAKRALTLEQLRKITTAELPESLEVFRDIWVLIFCLRGINFVDLCRLERLDADGYVRYERAKTHRRYAVKVEPEARRLIERYRGRRQLLMMLDKHPEYRVYYEHLRRGLVKVTEALNRIDDGVRIDKLTTYHARHSWATAAAWLDIPKETIAAALGHGGNTVTDVYIDFDMRKVDVANRRVLDHVFYGR